MAFRLSIEDGSLLQTLQVSQERLKVGKAAANDLRLTSSGVSSRHCTIRQNGNTLVVMDLHSKSGLVQRGRQHERLVLRVGDGVEIGDAVLTLVFIDGEAPVEAEPGPELGSSLASRGVGGAGLGAAVATQPAATQPVVTQPVGAASVRTESRSASETRGLELEPWQPPPRQVAAESRAAVQQATGGATASPSGESRRLPAHLQEPEFSDLAYQAWRQTPWWLMSIATHALVFLGLTFVTFSNTPMYHPIDATIGVSQNDDGYLDDAPEVSPDAYDDDDPLDKMERPEEELTPRAVEDDHPEPEDDELSPMQDDPAFSSPFNSDVPEPGDRVIGVAESIVGGGMFGTQFDKTGADMAQRKAAGALESNPFSRALLRGLRVRTTEENVRIMRGQYDKAERVFSTLKLKHGYLSYDSLARGVPSASVRAILINCSGEVMSPKARRNLREWVKRGGWLFTTDWALERVVHKCFKGNIAPLMKGNKPVLTNDETIRVHADAGHPLLKGVPEGKQEARWWLEDSSYPFVVKNRRNVEVLVRSKDLKERWNSENVAATFPVGKGRVVHVIGHLFQREGNLRGAYGMQRLLLNFLYRAIRRR